MTTFAFGISLMRLAKQFNSQKVENVELDTDRKLNLSLVRLLEIIGEAARSISEEFRDSHPDLSWKSMVGMRDRLIHGYFDVNLDVVWETVTQDLPSLIAQLEKIVAD